MAANVGWKGTMIAPATMAATALFERILRVHQSGEPPMRDVRARIRHIVLMKIEKALRSSHPPTNSDSPTMKSGPSGGTTSAGFIAGMQRRRVPEPPQPKEAEFEKVSIAMFENQRLR